MSMTIINNKPSITEMQLHAMLTGDVKGATKLDGWDAFKNFFIKLLNHLPGISLEDKESVLRDIYEQIYGTESASVFDEHTKSIEPVWNALDKLIHMMEKDKVQTITVGIQRHDDTYSTQCNDPLSEIRVNITIDGHSLADILCANTVLNHNMLNSIVENYMTAKTDDSDHTFCKIYELNPDILTTTDENTVFFNSTARTTNNYGFNVAKEIDKCHSFLADPLNNNINAETRFTDEVEQIERNQQLVSVLNKLKIDGGESITWHNTLIEETITKLEQRREVQQTSFQAINHDFVELLVQKWITKLEQSQPLLKEEISADINKITTIDSRSLELFTESDHARLDQLPKQLKVVYQIADLETQMSSPTEPTQEYFSNLTTIIINTTNGPLKEVLMTHNQRMIANKVKKKEQENLYRQVFQALTKKIDNWTIQVNTQPISSTATPTIKSQLTSFKNEIAQQHLSQELKALLDNKIDKLIGQHEKIKAIESKLNNYESQNKRVSNEDLKILIGEKESLMPCTRRSEIGIRITELINKNIEFDNISIVLNALKSDIAHVNKNHAVYSDALKNRLTKIEERTKVLSLTEVEKKPLLDNIVFAKEELIKLQQQDEIYAQVRTLLGPDTPSTSTPSANWEMALSQLKLAAASLKTLPESTRKSLLEKNFSEDVKSALIMLADFCTQSLTGPEKTDYMKDREKDYILLRDLVRSNKLPNNTELEENITLIKHENKFKSTSLMQKILG